MQPPSRLALGRDASGESTSSRAAAHPEKLNDLLAYHILAKAHRSSLSHEFRALVAALSGLELIAVSPSHMLEGSCRDIAPTLVAGTRTCGGNELAIAFSQYKNLTIGQPESTWFPTNWHKPLRPTAPESYTKWFVQAEDPIAAYVAHLRSVAPLIVPTFQCRCGIIANQSHTVAVHIRCSDVPFLKNWNTHLPDPSYFAFVASHLHKHNAPRRLVIYSSSAHTGVGTGRDTMWYGRSEERLFPNDEERRACGALTDGVSAFFTSRGFAVTLAPRDESSEATLANLLGSSFVVQTSTSSFSFWPGLVKAISDQHPWRFITPAYYREGPDTRATKVVHSAKLSTVLNANVPWTMATERCLVLHSLVRNASDYVHLVHRYARELHRGLQEAAGDACEWLPTHAR